MIAVFQYFNFLATPYFRQHSGVTGNIIIVYRCMLYYRYRLGFNASQLAIGIINPKTILLNKEIYVQIIKYDVDYNL